MRKKPVWTVLIVLIVLIVSAVALAVLFCSCAAPPAMTEKDIEKIHELAGLFSEDLQKNIVPQRGRPDALADNGYVVSRKDYSLGTDALAMFWGNYQAEKDCEVTMVFANDSFVVARVVFVEGSCYYLRYEYSKTNKDSLDINGDSITNVELIHQESPPKWTLNLNNGKTQRASFKFINPS